MSFWDWLFNRRPRKPTPVLPKLHAVAVTVFDSKGPVEGAAVTLDSIPKAFHGVTNYAGYVVFNEVPIDVTASHVWVTAEDRIAYSHHVELGKVNQTIRIGDKDVGPDDIELPAMERSVPIGPMRGTMGLGPKQFMCDGKWWFPIFVSGFTLPVLLQRDAVKAQAFLNWVVTNGFNGVRVFAGSLHWGNWVQGAPEARTGLPAMLDLLQKMGLAAEITAVTDSAKGGYNVEEHLHAIYDIVRGRPNVMVEIANEPYHASQSQTVHDFSWLKRMAEKCPVPVACGAPAGDEPDEAFLKSLGGTYATVHVSRDRDEWNMARHVKESERFVSIGNKPTMNNEPIGWAEAAQPGRRSANPNVAFAMGVMSRLFVSGVVSHAEHGLTCDLPGPVQHQCHKALVDGVKLIPNTARLLWKNSKNGGSWPDSPVDQIDTKKVLRAYSGSTDFGNRAWTVAVGVQGTDPALRFINGWRVEHVLAQRPGIHVYQLSR